MEQPNSAVAKVYLKESFINVCCKVFCFAFQDVASNLYHNTDQLDNSDVDHLLLVSKVSLFSHVEKVVQDVIRTRTFRGNMICLDFRKRAESRKVPSKNLIYRFS